MNYIDEIAVQIAKQLGDSDDEIDRMPMQDARLYHFYALLALTTGEHTTLENVHDAWSAWKASIDPDHRSLLPFDQLHPDTQELDRKYADAIRSVAVFIKAAPFVRAIVVSDG